MVSRRGRSRSCRDCIESPGLAARDRGLSAKASRRSIADVDAADAADPAIAALVDHDDAAEAAAPEAVAVMAALPTGGRGGERGGGNRSDGGDGENGIAQHGSLLCLFLDAFPASYAHQSEEGCAGFMVARGNLSSQIRTPSALEHIQSRWKAECAPDSFYRRPTNKKRHRCDLAAVALDRLYAGGAASADPDAARAPRGGGPAPAAIAVGEGGAEAVHARAAAPTPTTTAPTSAAMPAAESATAESTTSERDMAAAPAACRGVAGCERNAAESRNGGDGEDCLTQHAIVSFQFHFAFAHALIGKPVSAFPGHARVVVLVACDAEPHRRVGRLAANATGSSGSKCDRTAELFRRLVNDVHPQFSLRGIVAAGGQSCRTAPSPL